MFSEKMKSGLFGIAIGFFVFIPLNLIIFGFINPLNSYYDSILFSLIVAGVGMYVMFLGFYGMNFLYRNE